MTDSTAGSEPRTAAGRSLDDECGDEVVAGGSIREYILAIEAEARSLAPESEGLRRTADAPRLRELFVEALTVDSQTKDRRRRAFNQAIFDAKGGWQVFNDTDLGMVMEKFDKAVRAALNPESETGSAAK